MSPEIALVLFWSPEIEMLLKLVPIAASGISAYVGVRIALVEIKTKQAAQAREIEKHDDRLIWLERNQPHLSHKS
jgi:hypothetical protein